MSKTYTMPPQLSLDKNKDYSAVFKTEAGDFKVKLFAAEVPNTVNNFVFLAKDGYYDNTTFHRVINGFMAQGGDPSGTGRGGPGYDFEDEFHPKLRHNRAGILSMANAGPNTNGSQFFITHGPTPHLNDRHAVFGEVVEGMDVVYKIRERDPMLDRQPGTRIDTIEIIETEKIPS